MRFSRIVTIVAGLIALLLIVQGILGLTVPPMFVRVVRVFQTPPAIYIAAVLRIAIGVVLIRAASAARLPNFLRVLGFIIVIGGLLTPFVGTWFVHLILSWWSEHGPALVRLFAAVSLALGLLIAYAVAPKSRSG